MVEHFVDEVMMPLLQRVYISRVVRKASLVRLKVVEIFTSIQSLYFEESTINTVIITLFFNLTISLERVIVLCINRLVNKLF